MVNPDLFKPFVAKLSRYCQLSEDDNEALRLFASAPVSSLGPRQDIIIEGGIPRHVSLVLRGWACRYKLLESGRRQIFAYLLPGDLSDLGPFGLRNMDHSIAAIAPTTIAEIPREAIASLIADGSQLARALWCSSLAAQAIEREWIVNIGQRSALERLGHLLCELFLRLDAIGLTTGMSFIFPLTQVELADSTGLSVVHVNRNLQELRRRGLLGLEGKALTILDWDGLKAVSHFTPSYLHLDEDRGISPGLRYESFDPDPEKSAPFRDDA